jgi:hypothetical protein
MLAIQFRKVVYSFLLIRLTRLEHVIVDDQNAMTNRNGGTLSSSSCSNPLILRAQLRILGSRSGLGSLHQDSFGPMIALANTSAEPFAATLVVAWVDPDQRGEVSGIRERRHIPADLGKLDLNAAPTQARDGIQQLDLFLKRE